MRPRPAVGWRHPRRAQPVGWAEWDSPVGEEVTRHRRPIQPRSAAGKRRLWRSQPAGRAAPMAVRATARRMAPLTLLRLRPRRAALLLKRCRPPRDRAESAQSTAMTSFAGVSVQSTAMVPIGAPTRRYGGDQRDRAGGAGQAFDNLGPDRLRLLDRASRQGLRRDADRWREQCRRRPAGAARHGFRDRNSGGSKALATAVSSTFDFRYRGDLLLGLIDGSGEFSISANGVEILSESFVDDDSVINLGSNLGPNIDLTFMSPCGSGVFAVGGAVPEPSTWAMMLLGFASLGFAGYFRARTLRMF